MLFTGRPTKRMAVAVVGVIVLATGAARIKPPLQRVNEEAGAWVTAHAKRLPSDLNTIASLPYAHRRAIVGRLPLPQRRQFLTEQLDAFLLAPAQRSPIQARVAAGLPTSLTRPQLDFVRWTRDSLQEVLTPTVTAAQFGAFGRLVCARSKKLFAEEVARKVFMTIGPVDHNYDELIQKSRQVNRATIVPLASARMRGWAMKARLLAQTACNCGDAALCECEGCTYEPCTEVPGCGCLTSVMCVGLCPQ